MTTKELINRLLECPPDWIVEVRAADIGVGANVDAPLTDIILKGGRKSNVVLMADDLCC